MKAVLYAAVGDKIYFLLMHNICYINNFKVLIIDVNLIVPHVLFFRKLNKNYIFL